MGFIDKFLNSITMYRLVLYGLGLIAAAAFVFACFEQLSFAPLSLIYSGAILLTVCFSFNFILSKISGRAMNLESADITALILFLIVAPPATVTGALVIAAVGVLAMASKYIFAWRGKHIFNPAAIALVILTLSGSSISFWWMATPLLLPFTAIVGLLIVRKLRRFPLFISFAIMALAVILYHGLMAGADAVDTLRMAFLSYPLVFLGTIMLTEPYTMPPTRNLQMIYGAIVGVLFGSQFSFGPIFSTPELALVVGNIFAFIVSPKYRLRLTLKESRKLAADIYEFVFKTPIRPGFKPGQYFEWTLPKFFLDGRGNRRYFTIASSPTEPELRIGVRVMEKGSRFKRELVAMKPGEPLSAASLSGEFTLPDDPNEKLVFIAGGIGITPFRSMAKYLIDKQERRDVQLIYSCLTKEYFVYQDIFTAAEAVGWKAHYLATDTDGYLTKELLEQRIPNFRERTYYLSGPNAMVENYEKMLLGLGIARTQIKKDYFPGF